MSCKVTTTGPTCPVQTLKQLDAGNKYDVASLLRKERQDGRRRVHERRQINLMRRNCRESSTPELRGGLFDGVHTDIEKIKAALATIAKAQADRRQRFERAKEATKEATKEAAKVAKEKTQKIVKQCTPCMVSHDDHGNNVGISMKQWRKNNCDFCIGKDIYMGKGAALGEWVDFSEYKKMRTTWEQKKQKDQKDQQERCTALGVNTGTLCNGDGVKNLILQCAQKNKQITMDDVEKYAREFEQNDDKGSGRIGTNELIAFLKASDHTTNLGNVAANKRAQSILGQWGTNLAFTFEQFVRWRHDCSNI